MFGGGGFAVEDGRLPAGHFLHNAEGFFFEAVSDGVSGGKGIGYGAVGEHGEFHGDDAGYAGGAGFGGVTEVFADEVGEGFAAAVVLGHGRHFGGGYVVGFAEGVAEVEVEGEVEADGDGAFVEVTGAPGGHGNEEVHDGLVEVAEAGLLDGDVGQFAGGFDGEVDVYGDGGVVAEGDVGNFEVGVDPLAHAIGAAGELGEHVGLEGVEFLFAGDRGVCRGRLGKNCVR